MESQYYQFYWEQTGTIFGEGPLNWAPGKPTLSDFEVNCVAMSAELGLQWIDTDCSQQKLFVCEIPACPDALGQNRQNLTENIMN